MKKRIRVTGWLLMILGTQEVASGGEILIHEAPVVMTEALYSPRTGQSDDGKSVVFRRQFFVDEEVIAGLRMSRTLPPVPALNAVEAIKLALGSVELGDGSGEPVVTRVELVDVLVTRGERKKNVDFYLISIRASGSEVERVILMNGAVVKPRLTQVKEP